MHRYLVLTFLLACNGGGVLLPESDTDADTDADADADTDTDADVDADVDTDVEPTPPPPTPTPTPPPTPTPTPEPCGNILVSTEPSNGELDVFFGSTVTFQIGAPEALATVELRQNGQLVTGQVDYPEPFLVRFTPDELLLPDTDYEAELFWSCESEQTTFRTSTTGLPLQGPLAGRSWGLDLAAGDWTEPANLGGLLSAQITQQLLVGVETDLGSSLQILAVPGTPASISQPTCVATETTTIGFNDDPFFETNVPSLSLDASGTSIDLYDVELSGAFNPDGSQIQGGRLALTANIEQIGASVDLGLGGSLCPQVALFGVQCQPCPNGGPVECLDFTVENIIGNERAQGLTPRPAATIITDPNCMGNGAWTCSSTRGSGVLWLTPLLWLGRRRSTRSQRP